MRWQDIDGWLTDVEGDKLRELATGNYCLEFGTWCGRSAIAMAQVAERVVCVDRFDDGRLALLMENIKAFGLDGKIDIVLTDIRHFSPVSLAKCMGLVYVDSNHDAAAVRRDTELALQLVRPGGYIAWHDYGHNGWPDVMPTLDDMGIKPDGRAEYLAFKRF
jgi:predicted O-methyltransferase YrrM